MNDMISKKFLIFAAIWSFILGFSIKGALAMIAYALVVTPIIGIPFMIASIFAVIIVAHVITRAEYYNEYAINKVYAIVLTLFAFAGIIIGLVLPSFKFLI
jgi:heme/copper-type cytochrome/quinol oxidase subunit 4